MSYDPAPWVRLIDPPCSHATELTVPQRDALHRQIVQATAMLPYRLTPSQIRFARMALGMSNVSLAGHLRVSIWTVCRWQSATSPQRPSVTHEVMLRELMRGVGEDSARHLGIGRVAADRLVDAMKSSRNSSLKPTPLTFRWLPDDPRRPTGPGAWLQLTDGRWLVREGRPAGPRLPLRDVIVFPGSSDPTANSVAEAMLTVRCLLQPGDTLRIVAPFLSVQVVEAMTDGTDFQIITDISACLDANPCPRLRRFIVDNADRIRHRPGAHAKLVAHTLAGFAGSANMTISAAEYRDETGFLTFTPELVGALNENFAHLWSLAVPLPIEQIKAGEALPPSLLRRESIAPSGSWFRSLRRARRAIAAKQRALRTGEPGVFHIASERTRGGAAWPSVPARYAAPGGRLSTRSEGMLVGNPAPHLLCPSPAEVMLAEGELMRAALSRTTASAEQAEWLLERVADVAAVGELSVDDPRLAQLACRSRSSAFGTIVNRRRVLHVDRRTGAVSLLFPRLPESFRAAVSPRSAADAVDGYIDVADLSDVADATRVADVADVADVAGIAGAAGAAGAAGIAGAAGAAGAADNARVGEVRSRASIAAAERRRRATPSRVGLARDVDEGVYISYRHASGAVTMTLPFHVAMAFWDELEPLWHEAIRGEVLTCRASSHLRRHSRDADRLTRSDDARTRIAAAVHTPPLATAA